MDKMDDFIQGQGHSEGSECQRMFVQMISSEPQDMALSNLVWWCSIMSQSAIWKIMFALFKVKDTAKAHVIKYVFFLLYLLNCWFFGNKIWSEDTSS